MDHILESYDTPWSVQAGNELQLHASTDVRRYSVKIARLGWRREPVWQATKRMIHSFSD